MADAETPVDVGSINGGVGVGVPDAPQSTFEVGVEPEIKVPHEQKLIGAINTLNEKRAAVQERTLKDVEGKVTSEQLPVGYVPAVESTSPGKLIASDTTVNEEGRQVERKTYKDPTSGNISVKEIPLESEVSATVRREEADQVASEAMAGYKKQVGNEARKGIT